MTKVEPSKESMAEAWKLMDEPPLPCYPTDSPKLTNIARRLDELKEKYYAAQMSYEEEADVHNCTKAERADAEARAVAPWREMVRELVEAMREWGSWEDGVPETCDTDDVGRTYDKARALLEEEEE